MEYVCGFLMSWDLKRIVMIKKNKPDCMKGLFNGVGGKIKYGFRHKINKEEILVPRYPEEVIPVNIINDWERWKESAKFAIAREFEEETGVKIPISAWHCFHIEQYNHESVSKLHNTVYYMVTFGDAINKVRTVTDEEIKILTYEDITFEPKEFLFNIPYLIMMILCQVRNKSLMDLNPENSNYEYL